MIKSFIPITRNLVIAYRAKMKQHNIIDISKEEYKLFSQIVN